MSPSEWMDQLVYDLIEHYQADLMPGSLAYGLLRLAALSSKPPVEAEPNYFHR